MSPTSSGLVSGRRRITIGALAVLGVGATLAGASVSITGGGEPASPGNGVWPAELQADFSAARQPATAFVRPPERIAEALATENAKLDAAVVVSPAGERIFLVPTDKGVCFAGPQGFACTFTSDAARGQAAIAEMCPLGRNDAVRLTGLAPDGTQSVSAVREDGSRTVLPLQMNVYSAVVPSKPRITWLEVEGGPQGTLRFPAPVPADAATIGCA